MVKILVSKRLPAAATLIGMLWVSACAANQSGDSAAAMPGSGQSILAAKQPGVYGPHLAAADVAGPQQGAQPMPGSSQAVMSAKQPGVYGPHLAAADVAQAAPRYNTCQPGSFAAVMSAKQSPSARPGNPEIYKDCR